MTLQKLHETILTDPPLSYDKRFSPAFTEDEYRSYCLSDGCFYYSYLQRLVKRVQPKSILELGTSIGRSALFMISSLPEDSTLTTIDIGSYLRTDLSAFSYDPRLKIIYGDDIDTEVSKQADSQYDLLFMDSEHTYEQLISEWTIYQEKLLDQALVVMDDIHLNTGMDTFWERIPYEKVDCGLKLHIAGFGLFRFTK